MKGFKTIAVLAWMTVILSGCCGPERDELLLQTGTGMAEQAAAYNDSYVTLLDSLEASNPGVDFGPILQELRVMARKDAELLAMLQAAISLGEVDQALADRVLTLIEGATE